VEDTATGGIPQRQDAKAVVLDLLGDTRGIGNSRI
jgi:hypothetical protein